MRSGHAHRYQFRVDDSHVVAGLCIGIGGVRIDRAVALRILDAVSDNVQINGPTMSRARSSGYVAFTGCVHFCDGLSSFSPQAKATLHEPNGMSGADVEQFYRDGRIREIADYCETDVVNTYRVWLRYELFRGRLTDAEFQASEGNLVEFIKAHGNTKSHLADLM
jgi:hypothetical protein